MATAWDIEYIGGFNELQTVFSEDCTPRRNSDSSDMGDNCELGFHQKERLEIHWFRQIVTREYETFSVWLIENASQEALYASFCSYLESGLAAGG